MQFDIVTLFPEMFDAMDYGVVGRAKGQGDIKLNYWNPRDYTKDNYHKVDDASYGGGPGMVMLVQPLREAIKKARQASKKESLLVYLTPQGNLLNQKMVKEFVNQDKNLILVSGRYEGIDERLMELEPGVEVSIGDYVLSGGELAAMVVIDAITRNIPGIVGDVGSVEQDSFYSGILDYPHYTRPEVIDGCGVPKVLLSGDHAKINRWRRRESLGRTWLRRPELLEKIELTADDRMLLNEFIKDIKSH